VLVSDGIDTYMAVLEPTDSLELAMMLETELSREREKVKYKAGRWG
jgi:hypothetical protein